MAWKFCVPGAVPSVTGERVLRRHVECQRDRGTPRHGETQDSAHSSRTSRREVARPGRRLMLPFGCGRGRGCVKERFTDFENLTGNCARALEQIGWAPCPRPEGASARSYVLERWNEISSIKLLHEYSMSYYMLADIAFHYQSHLAFPAVSGMPGHSWHSKHQSSDGTIQLSKAGRLGINSGAGSLRLQVLFHLGLLHVVNPLLKRLRFFQCIGTSLGGHVFTGCL